MKSCGTNLYVMSVGRNFLNAADWGVCRFERNANRTQYVLHKSAKAPVYLSGIQAIMNKDINFQITVDSWLLTLESHKSLVTNICQYESSSGSSKISAGRGRNMSYKPPHSPPPPPPAASEARFCQRRATFPISWMKF